MNIFKLFFLEILKNKISFEASHGQFLWYRFVVCDAVLC